MNSAAHLTPPGVRAQIVDIIAEILLDDLAREKGEDTEQREEPA